MKSRNGNTTLRSLDFYGLEGVKILKITVQVGCYLLVCMIMWEIKE